MSRTRIAALIAAGLALAAASAAPTAYAQDLPAEATDVRGETYYLNNEHTHYVTSLKEAAQPYAQLDSAQQEKAVAIADAAVAGLIDAGVIHDGPTPEAEAPVETATPITEPTTPVAVPAEEAVGAADVDPSDPAPLAAGHVKFPPVLTIADAVWFLNADGHTYVADVQRVNATPTPEEVAASNELVQANQGEVGRQGLQAARAAGEVPVAEAPAGGSAAETPYAATRGIAAETGSNTLMRVLASLLVMSLFGGTALSVARVRR